MTRAQSIKVDRLRLIDQLKARQTEHNKARLGLFREELADEIHEAERHVRKAQNELGALKKVKTPDDAGDLCWARHYREDNDLAKHIRLLELSDEDTIALGPTSNLWGWL